ncbi:hypothetical protein OLEAN_C26460 [Oleispira antarctica RB-8]|uniref:ParB/Sulfiredoxin domain-containing protein n=1 Tax=Oleispira antarctica RB-8 TaxID=698738 RepID=R4YP51_OLEAN|nr:hypothetical protein OLEAN_C26460 [Oleispira antarctica RB-8]
MIEEQDKKVSLDQLILDPNNYRLIDEKEDKFIPDIKAEELEGETLKRLENQRLGELKDSILNNGFLEMERVVIRLLQTKKNLAETNERKKKYIVVEGNRRTAALKSLIGKPKKELSYERLLSKVKSMNVVFIDGTPEQIFTYSATLMGIRHVSGPKKWDGFQSAKLINDLYEKGNTFTDIGEILGITNREVGRRFRGYQAFKQMKSDTTYKDKVEPRHYGLLLEFLASSKDGKNWLEWNDTTFEFENHENLEVVYNAITSNSVGDLEVRNPADARKFVSLLGTHYKNDIENGCSIHDMPDPDDLKESGRLKRINSFIAFVEKNSFNEEENDKLSELHANLQKKLGE